MAEATLKYWGDVKLEKLKGDKKIAYMKYVRTQLRGSFAEALGFLMKEGGYTTGDLSETAWISERSIDRLRSVKNESVHLEQIIGVAIGMHLPPWISRELISLAGYRLTDSDRHIAYSIILDLFYLKSLDEVQQFMVSSGMAPLKLKDQYALDKTPAI